MKKWKSKLFPVITLAVCLGLAACGGGAESEGSSDDQEDYEETENSAPESFEGMVKDPDITAVYDMYWGTWIGEDDSELIVGLNGSGEDRFEWYDEDDNLMASGYIQLVPEYEADYFYNEHDGWAHHVWRDEDGALHICNRFHIGHTDLLPHFRRGRRNTGNILKTACSYPFHGSGR